MCGHAPVVVETADTATCPNCSQSYLLVVRQGFALMEWNGWVARVALDAFDDLTSAVTTG